MERTIYNVRLKASQSSSQLSNLIQIKNEYYNMNRFPLLFFMFSMLVSTESYSQRLMENLDRGVIAVRKPGGAVFVSWRLLGTESYDLEFNVYRSIGTKKFQKLNKNPVSQATNIDLVPNI